MSLRLRQILLPLLFIIGIEGWLQITNGNWGWGRSIHVEFLIASLAIAAIPPVRRTIWKFLRRLRRPSPRTRTLTSIGVTLFAALCLTQYAYTSGRDLFPSMHDEFQFLLQTRMLASGRLWMPGHPLLDFFDTFYVLIQPKYAAQSFPGAAFFFIPAVWFHLPPWTCAIAIAAGIVGLFYRVVAELIDGLASLLAAALMGILPLLCFVSTKVLAQSPLVLLGLATVGAYLHWHRQRSAKWAAIAGFLAGFTLITRPSDALIFILPVGIAVLLDVRRKPSGAIQAITTASLAASPWLALQLVMNFGITGHWLQTPFALYNQRDQPRLAYALNISPQPQIPLTRVPEKQAYYASGVSWRLAQHKPSLMWSTFWTERLPVSTLLVVPQPMLLALLPVGLLVWRRKRAWILACGLPLFFILFTPYPLYAMHYPFVAAPSAILWVLLAPVAITAVWPKSRSFVWTAMTLFVAAVALFPNMNTGLMLQSLAFHDKMLKATNSQLDTLAQKGQHAVVLFKRDLTYTNEIEPVYNTTALWPDDELIIRAHDRGNENWKIFDYYGEKKPDRAFYRFDETKLDDPLTYLGLGSELAGGDKITVGH